MSQYLEIYVKSKEDNFTYLDAFSRSTCMYHLLNEDIGAPYEKVRRMTKARLQEAIGIGSNYLQSIIERKKKQEDTLKLISSFNNSVDEKMEAIYEHQEILEEYDDSITEWEWTLNYLRVLLNMAENMSYEESKTGLYYGIEAGSPTLEDVVE